MVSAQQSRLKKKNEVLYLHKLIRDKDDKNQVLLDILKDILQDDPSNLNSIAQEMQSKIDNDSDGEDSDAKAAEANKRQKVSTPEEFEQIFLDRMLTKQSALEKYQQNDEKDDGHYKGEDEENDEDED